MMRELSFIERMLDEVGPLVRARYVDRQAMQVTAKADPVDLMTEVDLEVQRRLQRAIWAEFSGDVIVAEEEGLDRPPEETGARCWILDPIDGTHNFVRGMVGTFGVSIAFAQNGQVVAGGVEFPELNRHFTAGRGAGAHCNGEMIRVSEVGVFAESQLEIDFTRPERRGPILAACGELMRDAGQIRCHGSATFALCSVANGNADAYVHAGLKTWDWAAAALIVEEAGGKVTGFDGRPLRLFESESTALVASNGVLHEQALERVVRAA